MPRSRKREVYIRREDYTINPNEYSTKSFNIVIKKEDVVRTLWYLKSLIRCRLESDSLRRVLGSGKKDYNWISRVFIDYENNRINVICLLEKKEYCKKVFDVFRELENEVRGKEIDSNYLINEYADYFKKCKSLS